MTALMDYVRRKHKRITHAGTLVDVVAGMDNHMISIGEQRNERYWHASKLGICKLSAWRYIRGERGIPTRAGQWERSARGGHLIQALYEESLKHLDMLIAREVKLDSKEMVEALGEPQPFLASDYGMAGTVDGIGWYRGRRVLIEFKTARLDAWKMLGDNSEADKLSKWYIQVQVYMACTGLRDCLLFAICRDNLALDCFHVREDPQAQEYFLQRAFDLWYEHVLPGIEPEAEPSESNCLFCPYVHDCKYAMATPEKIAAIARLRIKNRGLQPDTDAHWLDDTDDALSALFNESAA